VVCLFLVDKDCEFIYRINKLAGMIVLSPGEMNFLKVYNLSVDRENTKFTDRQCHKMDRKLSVEQTLTTTKESNHAF
jgi:hypothetical protein